MMVDGKLHTTVHVVMCSAGLHETYGEWPIAVFTDPFKARDWCDRANEYGAWMVEMRDRNDKEQSQIDRVTYDDSMTDDEYIEACIGEPVTQYEWALFGSPGQQDQWEEEFEKNHPGGDWDYFWPRELSLMLNPYDERAFWARNERRIKYEVVEMLLDPDRPYFP
jgi:hypothetical protein